MRHLARAALAVLLTAAMVPVLAQRAPDYPPDNSEETAWYVERGAPSPDRAWTPNDVKRLADTLAPLAVSEPDKLPRLNSDHSGNLFRRAINAGNLDLVDSAPVESRLVPAMQYLQVNQQLMMVYLAPTNDGKVLDDEIAGLLGFALDTTRLVFVLMDQMLETLRGDPSFEQRRASIDQMRTGLAAATVGALAAAGERDVYRAAARALLIDALGRNLPFLSAYLTPDQRTENDVVLDRLVADEPDVGLKARLGEIKTSIAGV